MKTSYPMATAGACLLAIQSSSAALVAQYGFDEATGNIAIDSVGADDNGTIAGATRVAGIAPVSSPGFGTGALSFNGTSDKVDLGANQDLLQNVGGATLAAWVNANSFSGNGGNSIIGISVESNSGSARFVLQVSSGRLRAGGRDGNNGGGAVQGFSSFSGPTLTANTLYHLAATVDYAANIFELFVNGASVGSGSATNFIASNTTPDTASLASFIGSNSAGNGEFFDGTIDDARIYDSILPDNDIAALAVPEPSAALLGALGCLALLRRKR